MYVAAGCLTSYGNHNSLWIPSSFGLRPVNGMLTRGNRNRGGKHDSIIQVYPLIDEIRGMQGVSPYG